MHTSFLPLPQMRMLMTAGRPNHDDGMIVHAGLFMQVQSFVRSPQRRGCLMALTFLGGAVRFFQYWMPITLQGKLSMRLLGIARLLSCRGCFAGYRFC